MDLGHVHQESEHHPPEWDTKWSDYVIDRNIFIYRPVISGWKLLLLSNWVGSQLGSQNTNPSEPNFLQLAILISVLKLSTGGCFETEGLKYRGDRGVKELIGAPQELWLKGNEAVSWEQDMTNWHVSPAGLYPLYNGAALVLETSTSRSLFLIAPQSTSAIIHKSPYTNMFPSFFGRTVDREDGLRSEQSETGVAGEQNSWWTINQL